MPNTPLIIRAQSVVGGLALFVDGYQSHTHRMQSSIGGEPLEDGREVTDHVVARPSVIVLSGIVSDLGGDHRPAAAFEAIRNLWKTAEPVRVITEWETREEMVIQRCEPTSAGRGMTFEIELREILRVSAASGPAVPASAMTSAAAGRSGNVARGRERLLPPPESATDVT